MSLPIQYSGHRILGSASSPQVLELYLDYVCPYSALIWNQLYHHVLPWLEQEYPDHVQVIFRHQIQPWHPSSTLTAEAALAVEELDPSHFAGYSDVLFAQQSRFFDESVVEKSRKEQYKELAALVESVTDNTLKPEAVYGLLEIVSVEHPGRAANAGNILINSLKYFIKLGRQNGIHVSPTALWDGLVENSISSGWSLEDWQTFFRNRL